MSDFKKQITPENAKEYRDFVVECYRLQREFQQASKDVVSAKDNCDEAQKILREAIEELGEAELKAGDLKSKLQPLVDKAKNFTCNQKLLIVLDDGSVALFDSNAGFSKPYFGPYTLTDDVRIVSTRFIEAVRNLHEATCKSFGEDLDAERYSKAEIDTQIAIRNEVAKWLDAIRRGQKDLEPEKKSFDMEQLATASGKWVTEPNDVTSTVALKPEVGLVCMMRHAQRKPSTCKVKILAVSDEWISYEILEGEWEWFPGYCRETVGQIGQARISLTILYPRPDTNETTK